MPATRSSTRGWSTPWIALWRSNNCYRDIGRISLCSRKESFARSLSRPSRSTSIRSGASLGRQPRSRPIRRGLRPVAQRNSVVRHPPTAPRLPLPASQLVLDVREVELLVHEQYGEVVDEVRDLGHETFAPFELAGDDHLGCLFVHLLQDLVA